MNTTREKLLIRHQNAAPKLDAIRTGVVDSLRSGTAGTVAKPRHIRWPWIAFWQEVLYPCRRLLFGVATVWSLIALINFMALGDRSAVVSTASAPKVERKWLLTMLAEQRSLLDVDDQPPVSPPVTSPPAASPIVSPKPKPRSGLRPSELFA